MRSSWKLRLCIIFFGLHIFLIALTSTYMSINSYYTFYDDKEMPVKVMKPLANVLFNKFTRAYSTYSGAETGYGFFAPNVMSSGMLYFSQNGSPRYMSLRNQECLTRYMNMSGSFVFSALEEARDRQKKSKKHIPIVREQKGYAYLDSCYRDLLLKNISMRFMNGFKASDTLSVKLNVFDYVTLADYKENLPVKYSYITMYEKKYFYKNN